MWTISDTDYGYKINFEGRLGAPGLKDWIEASKLRITKSNFVVLIDLSKAGVLLQEEGKLMAEGQKLYWDRGMERSAVILDSAITKLQFKRIAAESGIISKERYFTTEENAQTMDWLLKEIDPDAK